MFNAYFIFEKLAKISHAKMEADVGWSIGILKNRNMQPNVNANMVFGVKTVNMKIVNKQII